MHAVKDWDIIQSTDQNISSTVCVLCVGFSKPLLKECQHLVLSALLQLQLLIQLNTF